jgi:hypothetical protein
MIPFTLAFDLEETKVDILKVTYKWEFVLDVGFSLHILMNFFTAYQ